MITTAKVRDFTPQTNNIDRAKLRDREVRPQFHVTAGRLDKTGMVRVRGEKELIGTVTVLLTTTTGNDIDAIPDIFAELVTNLGLDWIVAADDFPRITVRQLFIGDVASDYTGGDDTTEKVQTPANAQSYDLFVNEIGSRDFDSGGATDGWVEFPLEATSEALVFDFRDWAALETHKGMIRYEFWYNSDIPSYAVARSS